MDEIRLGAVELKFAEIVWANAPIPSSKTGDGSSS